MKSIFAFFALCTLSFGGHAMSESNIRVPAEWESHAATWIQWPGPYEADMRKPFADIIRVVQAYEPLHLLTSTPAEKTQAQKYLASQGVPNQNIVWHIVPVDNSWMRDNGPVYVSDGKHTWIQNWGFDAWGGNFGDRVEYAADNRIPAYVGEYLGLRVEDYTDYILERGNLEFNGADTLVLNWDCQDDRNPGMTQAAHEKILREAFGVNTILWAYGHHPEDYTTGHIDGIARFVSEGTLLIAETGQKTETDLANTARKAGFHVIWYPGDPNWLVGNGFVAAMGEGDSAHDNGLKAILEEAFPNRDIHMIDGRIIAKNGGGIHCVTNDQPLLQP